jgi:predicted nucleic acid-binding protein
VSEDGGAVPAPLILDVSVLVAIAGNDADVMSLIQGYRADRQPMVIPVLAITAALADAPGEDAEAVLHGLEMLENTSIAPLRDAEQAARLAAVIASTGLEPGDAQVAAVADLAVSPILTLNGEKWRQHAMDLGERLYFVEIAEPGEG